MSKQNWEEKFDKFIRPAIDNGFDDGKFSQKSYRDRFAWQGDIKDFIRQLLAEQKENWQKELAEKIEGMKYFIPTTKGLTILEYQREMKGYKRALTEVLKKLENGK